MEIFKLIKIRQEQIENIESNLYEEISRQLINELHEIFEWWSIAFPKRKNDLLFSSGMGIAFFEIKGYNPSYTQNPYDWTYKENPEYPACIEKLYDFFERVHKIGFEIDGFPIDIGLHTTTDYFITKANTRK